MSGPQCCENPPTLNPVSGSGHVEKVGGLDAYVSGSPDSKLCILLISEVFGYEAPKLRALADKVAASGFYVVVPDYFYGDPYNPADQDRPVLVWIKDHGCDKGFEDTIPVLEAIKNKGITAIGAAGMCWGGGKAPIAILGAELDHWTSPALVKQFEETLASKPEVPSYVKIHPKVSHGWTVRYNIDEPEAVKAAEEAHKEMLDWFVTYLK
ncbi:PREDICTED: endo-1,3;1,4-beta-D-glucanase-like isoform X1 [Camelina sativa]|uniref:Endo-1,31,4-beta-D-glucanase-like isoform X1 n=1 Tax=Camelina sativa TaxID=90675 RepID=A0ABM0XN87_CAMSA|nr:PREDICTED: endo-1,3;1,4-beta-D-glucanase-like isoform X1 [Camelina sativa]